LGTDFFSRACCDRTRGNGFKLKKGRFKLDIRKKFFAMGVVKDWTGCPVDVVDAQGQVGWCSEQPDLVEDVTAHCRGVGLDDL